MPGKLKKLNGRNVPMAAVSRSNSAYATPPEGAATGGLRYVQRRLVPD